MAQKRTGEWLPKFFIIAPRNPLVRRNVLSVIRSNSCRMTPKLAISYENSTIIGPGMRVGHVALSNRQTLQAATQQPTVTDAVVSEY